MKEQKKPTNGFDRWQSGNTNGVQYIFDGSMSKTATWISRMIDSGIEAEAKLLIKTIIWRRREQEEGKRWWYSLINCKVKIMAFINQQER